MDPLIALGIVLTAAGAGLLGSLLGLGGGIIIVPALTLLFGYSMQEAIGASLVAVIATSTGSASYYVEEGVSNVRLGLILGVVTSLGGLIGAMVAVYTDQYILALLFGLMLLYTAYYMIRSSESGGTCPAGPCGAFDLSCSYDEGEEKVEYGVRNLGKGMAGSMVGGVTSGMLGVGGGVVNVPVMRLWMGVPMRAACATSNYMMGITALAGAIIYFQFGIILAGLAAIVAIGVFCGSLIGSRLSKRLQGKALKTIFTVILIAVSLLMFLKAAGVMP
jgi:uncharacterized membrane protein YfcA